MKRVLADLALLFRKYPRIFLPAFRTGFGIQGKLRENDLGIECSPFGR
jgi:hypothetical protein